MRPFNNNTGKLYMYIRKTKLLVGDIENENFMHIQLHSLAIIYV